MRKLKFFLLSLCMIVALMACDVESESGLPDADSVVSALIEIKSRAVTLEDGMVYSVSHNGESAITSAGVMYNFDSDVSDQKIVFKDAISGKFIGFEGEGLGLVKFSMADTKDELFKATSEKVVKSPSPTWKDKDFTNKLVGRVYSGGSDTATFTVSAEGAPTKYYSELASVKYELVTVYSATQGWWKTADDTKFYGLTITKEGQDGTANAFSKTANEPTFAGTMTMLTKNNTSSTFLGKIKEKTASGMMGGITMSYSWDADGRVLTFDMGAQQVKYDFNESSDENIGEYGAELLTIAENGASGNYGGLPLTFGTFKKFVQDRVKGKKAKGKNTAGADITYTWNADGSMLTVDGGESTSHDYTEGSATSVLIAKYGTTVLSLTGSGDKDSPFSSPGGKFGDLSFTFDVAP